MDSTWLRFGLSASFLAILATTGCTTRKSVSPPAPSYPAVPLTSVRVLDQLPSPPYEALGTITVQTDADANREKAIADIRQRAGNDGANAIVILSEKVFSWRNEAIRQRLRSRRIVARALRLP
jgi:hypothetical protein